MVLRRYSRGSWYSTTGTTPLCCYARAMRRAVLTVRVRWRLIPWYLQPRYNGGGLRGTAVLTVRV
eukprot:2196630-Rhodomonas_salina.1